MKKLNEAHPVYNDGLAKFYSIIPAVDDYGTPIRGEFESVLKHEAWYRKLGITAQDTYYAHADDSELTRKIAIRGDIEIDTKWQCWLGDRKYEVYRYYYAYKNDETEISLVEVDNDE